MKAMSLPHVRCAAGVAGVFCLLLTGAGSSPEVAQARDRGVAAGTLRVSVCPRTQASPRVTDLRARALSASSTGFDIDVPSGRLVTAPVGSWSAGCDEAAVEAYLRAIKGERTRERSATPSTPDSPAPSRSVGTAVGARPTGIQAVTPDTASSMSACARWVPVWVGVGFCLGGGGWSLLAWARRRRERAALLRVLGFSGEPNQEIRVPAGPDGRPGEVLSATSRSPYYGALTADGVRSDFTVTLSRRLSQLIVVCFGSAADTTPQEHLQRVTAHLTDRFGATPVDGPRAMTVAGEPAAVGRLRWPSGTHLIEHRFVRDGWMFGVGIRLVRHDGRQVENLAYTVLDTWQWIPENCDAERPGTGTDCPSS